MVYYLKYRIHWILSIKNIKETVLKKINSNSLLQGTVIIGAGTAISQIVALIVIPLLTRLYTPYEFGIMGLFASLVSLLIAFTSLRYEYAIPIPKDEEDAAHLLILCVSLTTIISTIVMVFFYASGNIITTYTEYGKVLPFLWLVFFGALGGGIYQSLNYWAIRRRDYHRITSTKINQSVSSAVTKVALGVLSFGSVGLIIGQIISQVAGIGTLVKGIIKNDLPHFQNITITKLAFVARKYVVFPIYNAPASILVSISLQAAPIFILSYMFGIEVVGWYTLAYQVLIAPLSLIAGSISQVLYGEIAEKLKSKPQDILLIFKDTTKKILYISVPCVLIISLCAPFVFPIVFGNVWKMAGFYCLPLIFVIVPQVVLTPTSKLDLYGCNDWKFYLEILRIGLIMIGFGIGIWLQTDPFYTLLIYGFFVSLFYFVLYYANIRAIENLIQKSCV